MEAYMAMIVGFAGNFAPRGWMFCNGQILNISTNTALFSLLGTTYGGNGQTTFALPDLRGTVAISQGQAPGRTAYQLGEMGGTENASLTINNLPAHTHTAAIAIGVNDGRADATSPNGATLGQTEASTYSAAPDGASKLNPQAITATIGVAGSSQAFPIMQPYLAINYIICTEGLFPSRN